MKKAILTNLLLTGLSVAGTVPDFSAKDLEGTTRTLGEFLGARLTIISFWGMTCAPCKEELRLLDSLYGVFADSGLSVIAVNVDGKRSLASVAPMVASSVWSFTVLTDPEGEVMRLFKVAAVPHSVYLKPDKSIIKTVTGFTKKDESRVIQTVLEALQETPAAFRLGAPDTVRRSSSVEIVMEEDSEIDVFLADTLGARIKPIYSGELAAGTHTIRIDVGELAASRYLVYAVSGGVTQISELLILD